ncbi:MAG TPA: glycosyltransferase [Candidatus Paceibacterota bacterium]|nr:glycosyltransferase [Candidatus Paceibacterota bacterium]
MNDQPQNKAPRISILMPSWNAEKYVASTLDTIVMQSFTDWEAIVMDGGSKDRTVEIARGYQKKYPNIRIFSEPDEGPYHAIHKAALAARGEFLVEMCFSDGYLDKDWFAKCVAAMDADPELSLVWGIPFDMTEEGELKGPSYVYARFLPDEYRAKSPKTPVLKKFIKKIDVRRPSSILRVIKKINPTNARMAIHMFKHEEPKNKEAWFLYWLETGTIFPDLNMFMTKKVFFDCMEPYVMGTRETGDWMQFYFNFNTKGFLSRCIPVPANFGRVHEGSVSDRVRGYNDEKHRRYIKMVVEFEKKTLSHPGQFSFVDREGNPVRTLADYQGGPR